MIYIFDESTWGKCLLTRDGFSADYEPSKKYLGRERFMEQRVGGSLEFFFRTLEEKKKFFDYWKSELHNGGKPFYIKLPLFGDSKNYLVKQTGAWQQSVDNLTISGGFVLYKNRTLDENMPPVFNDKTVQIDMDSSNNFLLFQGTDADTGDVLSYRVITPPAHGTLGIGGNGAYYYTPSIGFSGVDFFEVVATDELGAGVQAKMTLNIVNWKLNEEFKLVMDDAGHLYIDYVNQDTLDPLIIQAVDELSMGTINNQGEYVIDVSQTQHIDSIIKTADNEWLVTPK